MKKIFFISNYSDLYGANKVLLTILSHFQNHGYQVFVLLPSKGAMSNELDKLNISYQIIPYFSSFLYIKFSLKYLAYPLLIILDLFAFFRILKCVNDFKPDIIYSNTSAENFGTLVSKILNVKHVYHIHEFMSLDHGAFFIGGCKLKKRFIDRSDGVIFVSRSVANYVNLGETLNGDKTVIYNGIEVPNLSINEKELSAKIEFGIVGIFTPGKGQHLAIEYFKDVLEEYPHAILHIYGDKNGTYKNHLYKLVEDLDLTNKIFFHGFVRDINQIYNQIDVLLMFSKSEGFGLVTVEAMLRGVLVIGLDNAGTSELIENEVTGYLFKNKQAFLKSISKLADKDSYNSIRQNAQNIAISRFNDKVYGNKIEDFVKSIYEK